MKQRIFYFDVLKGIAAISVMIIHVAYFYFGEPFGSEVHTGAIIVNNLFRFAVPFFFIISGLLLKPPSKDEGWVSFYTKKLKRIFLPYLLVSLGYWLYRGTPLVEWPRLLLTGETLEPYYFFIILFQLYLLYPFIYKIKLSAAAQIFVLTAGLLGLTLSLQRIGVMPFFAPYLPYFAFGILLADAFRDKPWRFGFKKLAVASVVLHILFFIFLPIYFYNLVYLYGVSCFIVFAATRSFWEQKTTMHQWLSWVGKYSLWFYLLHFSIVQFFYLLVISQFSAGQWPLSMLAIFSASLVVTSLLVAGVTKLVSFRA